MTKTLRKLQLAALCSAALLPTTQAKNIMLKGVTTEHGWVDINKSANGDTWANETEGYLCYAIAAANLITWWQSKYEVPEGTPNTAEDIWATYLSHAEPGGGATTYALQWWFSGQYYAPAFITSNKLLNDRKELYYNQEAVASTLDQLICFSGTQSFYEVSTSKAGLHATIINALENGIGLAIALNTAHTVTLWGVDIDEQTQQITKLWITDSDDSRSDKGNYTEPSIFSINVESINIEVRGNLIETLQLTGDDGNRGFKNSHITGLFGLDPSVSNREIWGLTPAAPEPTTTTLSLMALAALAARRRRH